MREIYNEQRFECGKNKDTNRKRERERKWMIKKRLYMYCNQIDHLGYWLERIKREIKIEIEINYVSLLSPFKRGIGVGCKNESK
jgi:hypothetical protein